MKSIEKITEHTLVIKKSEFICTLIPLNDEEKINEMLKSKKELADLTVQSGETWIGDLESKQIEEIFKLTH
mgnify:CR=1 FL=1